MPRPTITGVHPKHFKVNGNNQHFKVKGTNLDDWDLLNPPGLETTYDAEWVIDHWVVNPNFIHIFADPKRDRVAAGYAGATGPKATLTSGDLTITLTFENPDTGSPENLVEDCDDIEYEEP